MTNWLDKARAVKPIYQKAAQSLTDQDALKVKKIYSTWDELVKLGSVDTEGKTGYKFTHENKLYSCVNANPTFQAAWVPGVGTESLYTRIDEEHAGTYADPIPYEGNMALENGKYYSQGGIVYLCTRDTINPVFNDLAELVELYVEVANG